MTAVNAAITRAFDLFFAALAWGGPWSGMVGLAAVTAVVALLIFRWTSNQRRIRTVKDRIISHLLEVVLYRDELRVVLQAQAAIFRDNLRYFASALVPLAFMILPMAVLLIQADLRYGHRPLKVGERAIVAAKLRPGTAAPDQLAISAPSGIAVETPPLRIPALGEVDWRIRGLQPGAWNLRFSQGETTFTKQVLVGARAGRVSTTRVSESAWSQLLHPGERPLPSRGPAALVKVSYPGAELHLWKWRLHWVWPWLILSLVFGYLLKGPLRVEV